ncbi:TonB-dependent receptor domain-containing protein [Pannonibacter sp. SL95]|uniref:TonB-dependent receptor domain-containing protein n=1 Tax=Pannonibacter sp. SL95 TaxID=2995153 RepID=UPI002276FE65|nr:TonB-dependent receptor [Pannonibacter sp. SL95]MCY1707432.1 TonB-dependent receptor [Pannonibacter sp. SL95]
MVTARKHVTYLMGGVALLALAGTTSALAQQAAPASAPAAKTEAQTTALQRLVIGAGREKVAIDTPQAVTVINQEQIDDEQANTIGDFFRQTPGVTIAGSDRIGGQAYNIRGVGELSAADESKIIITVDGATKFYEQYRLGSFFSDPELYKQVEVLRGPASSTLYGAGAIGGVINFVTKDASDFLSPNEKAALRLKSMLDSNKEGLMTSAVLAARLGAQTEALINGNFRRSNDFDAGGGRKIPGSAFDSFSGLAKVTHHFGDNNEQSVRLSYERWQSDADNTAYSQTGTLTDFGNIDREITDQTLVFAYENPAQGNPFLDLKLNLSVSDTKVEQDKATARIPSALFRDSEYGYRTWQAKLENTFEAHGESFDNFLTLGTQLSYQQRTGKTKGGTGWVDFHPEGTDRKIGVFLQNEFIWNEKLTIIPGVRLDHVSLEPDSRIPGARSQSDLAFSPKIAAMYKFTESFSVFGSIAQTERLPTLDEMFTTGARSAAYPGGRSVSLGLKKEKSLNYEAGFAVSGQELVQEGDALQFKTTAFYNDLTNMIATNQLRGHPVAVPYFVNIHQAHIYGVELEADYQSKYAFANFAYSVVRGKDEKTKQRLTSIPADTLSVTLGARVPDYNVSFGWRGLFAATAPQSRDISSGTIKLSTAGYAVHDAFVSWTADENSQLKGWEVRAAVENIFDKRYQNNLAGDPGRGRTFKLTVNKQFGW